MKKKLSVRIAIYAGAILAAMVFIFPLYWTAETSFKTYKEAFRQPPQLFVLPDFTNYIKFFSQSDVLLLLRNSVIVTAFSVVIPMVVGVFASYALTRSTLRGKEGFGLFLLASRFIPPMSTVIPIYIIFRALGLYDTCRGLIILNCGTNIPYVIWMMRGFIKEVPVAIEESAWIDGCSRVRAFFEIVLPMCRSGIVATAVLIMVFSWNDYLYPLMMTSSKAKTLPLAMAAYMGEQGIEWNMMAAAGMIILLPTIIFSILTHRNLGSGLTLGAVKG
ncbi:MAG: carbohydrate ABC transporter permease [Eubacteriales bacterium]|nr:carbohydrate ABC transporter permease [Eubacteriales bacterium]